MSTTIKEDSSDKLAALIKADSCIASREEAEALEEAAAASSSIEKADDIDEADEDADDEEVEAQRGSNGFVIPQRFTRSGRKRATPFPLKLMKVLSDEQYAEIISWTPSGKSFNIIKPKMFQTEILPSHFKSAKYSSFTRKLHRWGFMRHYRGEEAGAFYHNYFQKGRLDLVEKMTCYKSDVPKVTIPASNNSSSKKASVAATAASQQKVTAASSTVLSGMQQLQQDQQPQCMGMRQMSNNMHNMMPHLQSQPPLHAPLQSPHPQNSVSDLNAAIEMEVNRRLKERMNAAAALNRHAMLMQMQSKAQQQQLNARLYAASSAFDTGLTPNSLMAAPASLYNNNPTNLAALAAYKYKNGSMPALSNNTYGNLTAFNSSLPGSNIQSAKTA